MLEQYMKIKSQHPDSILFYRMGDFYEMFYDDAKTASEVLGLRLTKRAHGKVAEVPLAGFPYHQVDSYLTRMVGAGYKVVIVEQVEDPKLAKGLVKRDIVRIATAGTNPAIIESDEPKSLRTASLIKEGNTWGLAYVNMATGEFKAGQFDDSNIKQIVSLVNPVEVVVPESQTDLTTTLYSSITYPVISKLELWIWENSFARQTILDHFSTIGLKGFGIESLSQAISAAGALLHYVKNNLRTDPEHIAGLARLDFSGTMQMEPSTCRNLELVSSLSSNNRATLFAVTDRTITNNGKRLLYERLLEPLSDKKRIDERLSAVEELFLKTKLRDDLRETLSQTSDFRRSIARLATGRGSARDLISIRDSLELIPTYRGYLSGVNSILLASLCDRLDDLTGLISVLSKAIVDEPPLATSEGGMIKAGYNKNVDELRELTSNNKNWLERFEKNERARTGISNLKVNYNKVFGYFIEVSSAQSKRIPDNYIRKQTLVNAERYITDELQEYAQKILTAEESVNKLELEIYTELVALTLKHALQIQENAQVLAELDFYAGLAKLAHDENYCKPLIIDENRISLSQSRHPVVENLMSPGQQFVPNDLELGGDQKLIHILTGPNMAGKSTYLRQIGLTVILAQMGSFVPAKEATIGVVDRLFTRIGALDNLAGGESTFLVEMQETASILHNATAKSLVLFDEVGRGTSTFDGLSLAWSIVEYLHETAGLCPRTLFATHYHELIELEKYLDKVSNWNVAVREYGDKITFLHKIIPGGSDHSFGIHVAMMAGLPQIVISRAREVLTNLESNDLKPVNSTEEIVSTESAPKVKGKKTLPKIHTVQLSMFDAVETRLRNKLKDIDINSITPLQAMQLLIDLKNLTD